MCGVHAFGEVYSNEGNLGVQNTRKVQPRNCSYGFK